MIAFDSIPSEFAPAASSRVHGRCVNPGFRKPILAFANISIEFAPTAPSPLCIGVRAASDPVTCHKVWAHWEGKSLQVLHVQHLAVAPQV
jgi:hypothetical protein